MRRKGMLAVMRLWAASGLAAEEEAAAASTVKFHTDAEAMQRDAAAAIEALMADDLERLRGIVERIEAGCRKLTPEEGRALGPHFRNRDQALHVVLNGTVGWIDEKKPNEAFTEFIWVLRTCRECHALARAAGYLPERGPIR